MIQTEEAISKIRKRFPAVDFKIKVIKTEGDKDVKTALAKLSGQGIFTKEIEKNLINEEIDIAVHSLKDLPTSINPKLTIGAITKRADARDVLISRKGFGLKDLPKGSVIGTDSPRRIGQLLAYRNDFKIKSIRGNVDTRIRKLEDGEYDAIVLAAAGVARLGLENKITEYLPMNIMLPAPGQGALAIEVRKNDSGVLKMVGAARHADTEIEVLQERAFLERLGGGCKVPVAAYAMISSNRLKMFGMAGDPEGRVVFRSSITARSSDTNTGSRLAGTMLADGAYNVLRGELVYTPLKGKRIVVTASKELAEKLSRELKTLGASVIKYPTIKAVPLNNYSYVDEALEKLDDYEWVVFTSSNGVGYAVQRMHQLGYSANILTSKMIAAVGPGTAKVLDKHKIRISYMPSDYLSSAIAAGIKGAKGKKVLLLRSAIASDALPKALRAKGIKVDDVAVYSTSIRNRPKAKKITASNNGIDMILFTSPSTVLGLVRGLDVNELSGAKFACIGPVTANEARANGLEPTIVANEHTANGLIKAILMDHESRRTGVGNEK